MAKKSRLEIKTIAEEIIQFFSASMKIEANAAIRAGKKVHLEPDIEPTKGYWVECKVFVPDDYGSEE